MRDRAALTTIPVIAAVAAALVAAVAIDFGLLEGGPRPTFEDSPASLLFMGLNLLAIVIAFRLPRPEHIAYVAACISVLLFALPALLLLTEDPAAAGSPAILLGRSWLVVAVWALAFVGMQRKRSLRDAESLHAELERQVAERTALYRDSIAAAELIGTRLRLAQAIARLGNWERDLKTGDVWWSEETFHLLGLAPGDVEPSCEAFLDRLHPDDRPGEHERLERAANLDKPRSAELRVILPNGSIRHLQTHSEIMVDDEGRPRKVVGTIQDVTERRKLELEVAELVQRLDALTNVAFDGVVVVENGVVSETSEALAAKLGSAVADIVGRPLADLIAPAFQDKVMGDLEGDGLDAHELVLSKHGGETVRVEAFSSAVTAADREILIIGFRDVGGRLELEREIIDAAERERKRIGYELREQVGQLLVSLKWSIQSLARRLRARESDEQEAQRLVEQIERIIAQTHKLSATISPQVPDSLEIYPALKMLTMEVSRHVGTNCALQCRANERVESRETSAHLYRIAEEAVWDAIRHGRARNIELSYRGRGDLFVLTIVDDGKGSATDESADDRVLRNLRYRARLINGVIEVRRRPTGGRQIVCSFPARRAASVTT